MSKALTRSEKSTAPGRFAMRPQIGSGSAMLETNKDLARKLIGREDFDRDTYISIRRAEPGFLVEVLRYGVSPELFKRVAKDLGTDQKTFSRWTGVAIQSVHRKLQNDKPLSPSESERVLDVSKLIGEAQRIVDESGNLEGFDAAKWVGEWVQTPVPALGDRKPAELLDTAVGAQEVLKVLQQSQSGAYA
jgi:putative toxin-antitoxin system antitoxin component (TIGR02293 family)